MPYMPRIADTATVRSILFAADEIARGDVGLTRLRRDPAPSPAVSTVLHLRAPHNLFVRFDT